MGARTMICVLFGIMAAAVAVLVFAQSEQAEAAQAGKETKEWDGQQPKSKFVSPGNKAFYKADGSFDGAATKEAYFGMMRSFGYPIPKVLKGDDFWICDFLSRDMEKLGMGGVFWINESGVYGETGAKAYAGKFKGGKFGYLGHEIYVLPGQGLPEHRHVGGEAGFGPKMEAWHVRHGEVEFFGEYKAGDDHILISDMPEKDRPWGYGEPWFHAKYVAKRNVGEVYKLQDPESWHFLRAGKDGAILSEYATFHNHVEFSKPGFAFDCSKANK